MDKTLLFRPVQVGGSSSPPALGRIERKNGMIMKYIENKRTESTPKSTELRR